MARNPENDFPNWEAPAGNFTKGRIRDNDGTLNGTPLNELTLGDVYQFFLKLMDDNGITPNGNADDIVDNQLITALNLNRRVWEGDVITNPDQFGGGPGYTGFDIQNTKAVVFDLGASVADDVVTFFTNAPVGTAITCYLTPTSGTFNIEINSTNLGLGEKPILQAGVSGTNQGTRRVINSNDSFTITVFDDFLLLDQPQI